MVQKSPTWHRISPFSRPARLAGSLLDAFGSWASPPQTDGAGPDGVGLSLRRGERHEKVQTPAVFPNVRPLTIVGIGAWSVLLLCGPRALAAPPTAARLVVVLYPTDNDGSPGNLEADHGIRSTFASGSAESVEVENEYLDVTRFPDAGYQGHLAEFLRLKYAGRKIDLVIAGLSSVAGFRGELP